MEFDKQSLIDWSEELYMTIQYNRDIVHPLYDTTSEIQKYYYGSLSRQLELTADITCLLRHGFHPFLSSVFILARTILDDFINIHYISNHADPGSQILLLNAEAHYKNLDKLKGLSEINHRLLGNNFPFYPTPAFVEEVKEKFKKAKPQYFEDIAKEKMFRYPTLRAIVKTYEGTKYEADMGRVYFNWRIYSDYVHFSKFSYEYEFEHPEGEISILELRETLYYCYLSLKLCMNYFDTTLNLKLIDSPLFSRKKVQFLSSINDI